MRIAKYIANAGLCSRREAEKFINQKKVFINGNCCDHPSIKVTLDDEIIVNKKKIKLDTVIRLWKMYKPVKTICTNKDPQNRKTIFELWNNMLTSFRCSSKSGRMRSGRRLK